MMFEAVEIGFRRSSAELLARFEVFAVPTERLYTIVHYNYKGDIATTYPVISDNGLTIDEAVTIVELVNPGSLDLDSEDEYLAIEVETEVIQLRSGPRTSVRDTNVDPE